MPYHIEKADKVYLVKDNKGKVYGWHKSRKAAQAQIHAIVINERKKK